MNYFLLPHQDDEYGVYPLLEEMANSGREITVVFLTSGTLDGSLSETRNLESSRVLGKLGLAQTHIHFLGGDHDFPDGKLHECIGAACAALDELLQRCGMPTSVYCPAWEGGHQDHDSANIIACRIALKYGCLASSRQFPLYTGAGLPWILWHTFYPLALNGEVESSAISWRSRLRYLRLCLAYRSQWRSWLGLYPPYLAYMVLRGRQYLQALDPERLAEPPHPGSPLYEKRGYCTRDEFRRHTGRMVDEVRSC